MIKTIIVMAMGCLLCVSSTFAADGLVRVQGKDSVQVVADRLQHILKDKGMHLFARIDHQAGAAQAGRQLRPTELFIFGNPQAGTPLMQCKQSFAIDLPQKMVIYLDEAGKTWIVYNDPAYLAKRHNLDGCGAKVLTKVNEILAEISQAAAEEYNAGR